MLSLLQSIFSKQNVNMKKNYIEAICNKENIFECVKRLKDDQNLIFDQLIDITAVDYPSKDLRFQVVYIFLSMVLNKRLILKTNIKENELIESITPIHKSAN